MGRSLGAWILRMVLGCLLGVAALVAVVLWRLAQGPIPLRALDRPIGEALAALAPDVTVRVGTTALVRVGRRIALEVGDVQLLAPDGTPTLSLAHVRVRPRLGALLRGRIAIARVDVDDAMLSLVRRADGAWALGGEGEETPLVLGHGAASPGAPAAVALPRILLARSRVRLDDRRAGLTVALSGVDLAVAPRRDGIDATLAATLDLTSAAPPIRGRVRAPLRAELGADLAADGVLSVVRFTVTADAGELAPADDGRPPFPLAGVEASGRWRPGEETLEVGRLVATIGTSRLDARARVVLAAPPVVGLEGTIDALSLSGLARLWPADLASAARRWVAASLREGELRRCRLRIGPPVSPAPDAGGVGAPSPAPAEASAVDVACDFTGVAADYLPPLDPIRDAAGSARLTAERLSVDVGSGAVGACRVDGGTFVMDFDVEPPRAAIAADVSGATADVLAIVEKPPIVFTPPLGIARATVGGAARVHAELHLPIATTVGPSDVTVRATAALTDARLPPLAAGIGIEHGTLAVRVDGARVDIEGTTAVTGLAPVTAPVTIALGVGPGAAAGEHAVSLALAGDGVAARGRARVAGNGLAALTVDELRLAGTDIGGSVTRTAQGGYAASITGARLDLDQLLAGRPLGGEDVAAAPPLTVTLDVAEVRTARDVDLRNVRGTIATAEGRLAAVDVRARLAPRGEVAVTLADGPAPRRVRLTSDQAGVVLGALGGLRQIVGGSLALDATTDARGPLASLDGTLVLRDFKVARAPVLAKILGIGSLGGIAALVQGEGMPMTTARVPFRWNGARLEVHDVRAVGAIGLTADGVIDRAAGTCDLRGNVIPAYTLNSALGRVPLLGRFLVGARGEGVFGIDYRVTGRLADPAVTVNPLTSIAPTVLRSWFIDPFTRAPSPASARAR